MSKLQERDVLLQPWFAIVIAGKDFGEDMLKFVTAVEVTDEDEKLSEATIEIADIEMKWLTGIDIGKGSSIVIRMGHSKNNMSVFRGKISIVEVVFPKEGYASLIIKGVDTGVKMMESRISKVYKDKKVSDVVADLHKQAGLEIECDDSGDILGHIQQTRETSAEFTHRWKKLLGWNYFKLKTGGYYFGEKKQVDFTKEVLSYRTGGLEIISFSPTYVDIETENKEDSKEIESKKAEEKTSPYETNYAKVASGGADAKVGKA